MAVTSAHKYILCGVCLSSTRGFLFSGNARAASMIYETVVASTAGACIVLVLCLSRARGGKVGLSKYGVVGFSAVRATTRLISDCELGSDGAQKSEYNCGRDGRCLEEENG